MPKKSRAQRRRRNKSGDGASDDEYIGGDDDNHSNNNDARSYEDGMGSVDQLSESHTIDMMSHNNNSTLASIEDDLDWDMDDDDDHRNFRANDHADNDAAERAERRRQQKLQTILSTSVDFAQEKRSSKREVLLKQWFKALTQYCTSPSGYEIVEQYRDNLLESCLQYALYKGSSSPAEHYAACRVLEALGVLIGSDHDLYEQTSKRLIRTIQSTHRASAVRTAALRALGMIVFCGDDVDDVIVESVMDLCETIILASDFRGQPTPTNLKAGAFQVWTVLATSLHILYVAGSDAATTGRGLPLLPIVLECLENESTSESALQLKEAAGQAVVYIHDARLMLGADESQVENTTDAQYKLGSWEHTEYEDIMEEISQAVYQLAHASGYHMSRKAKKEQRQVFRDYLGMLQDNEDPVHVVQFRGSSLELTTWKDVIALEYMRRCLQGGFQIQLMTNPTLNLMLGADGAALAAKGNGYSQLEKRLYMSKTSEVAKAKDLDRHKGRDKRNNIKNHFLTTDDDGM
ncbi:MAG: hypothetical protein SGILL_003604 [Bacillariaceae sp.]